MKRVLTAAVLLPLFALAVLAPEPAWFAALAAAAALLALREYFGIAEASGLSPFKALGAVWTLGLLAAAFRPDLVPASWVSGLVLLGAGGQAVLSGTAPADLLRGVAATAFGALYLGFLPGFLLALKGLDGRRGSGYVLLVCTAVWAGDTLAFYGGRLLGRHALAPRLSPGKTWEGALIGAAGSFAAAGLASATYLPEVAWPHALALGALVSVAGPFGDLFESALKRGAGIKDSSSLLPGHGGVLDRIDSLLFAAPAVFLYQQVVLP